MTRSASLSRQVSFRQVLPLLGVRINTTALPAVTTCPICHNRGHLHIYPDGNQGGEWSHCRTCHFSGNMISLARDCWKLDTKETVQRLVSLHAMPDTALHLDSLQKYDRDYVRYTHSQGIFLENCQKIHIQQATAPLRALHRMFNCAPDAHWATRGGRLLTSSTKALISQWWQSSLTNARSVFYGRGPGWGDIILIPYHDLPGRICGFVVIGRSGQQEAGDWFYLPTTTSTAGLDTGLAMVETLLQGYHPRFENTGFIFTDLPSALALQLRHLKDRERPLPLAAAWEDETTTTQPQEWLSHDDLVFWGPTDKVATIRLAKHHGGRVALAGVTPLQIKTNAKNRSPREWLTILKRSAAPWYVALEAYIEHLPSAEIESIFCRLGLHGQALTAFITGCRESTKQRLEHIRQHSTYARVIAIGKDKIKEHDGSWWLNETTRLTNAVVRIAQCLVTRGTSPKSYYRGVVKFNGVDYPFTERIEAIDAGLFDWTMTFLRDRMGVGMPEFYPRWNKQAVQVAIAFHPPKMVVGVETIGWDAENLQFNFPRFSLRRDGSVTDEFACLFDDAKLPGRELLPPDAIPLKYREALSDDNDETRLFWGVAAHVAATLMCAAMYREPCGLLLDGEGAHAIGMAAARKLGVVCYRAIDKSDPVAAIQRLVGKHHYPVGLESTSPGSWLEAPETRYLIYAGNWATSRVLAGRGKWNLLRCHRKLGSMQLVAAAATSVLPNYLQDAYRRGLLLPDEHNDLILNVLDDMADWFCRIGGSPETVQSARLALELPGVVPPWRHFAQLVARLYDERRLTFIKAVFDSATLPPAAMVEITRDEAVMLWISQDRFSDAVHAVGGLPPDLLLITKSLTDEGVLCKEATYRDSRGWLLPNDWWVNQLETWRKKCKSES